MLRFKMTLPLLALLQCESDETVAAYGAKDTRWRLESIADARFEAEVTLEFPETGKIAGQGPCNSFSGTQSAPYPWFEVTDLSASQISCPDLEAEGMFFAALLNMSQSEVSGNVLILRNDSGIEMLFKAVE